METPEFNNHIENAETFSLEAMQEEERVELGEMAGDAAAKVRNAYLLLSVYEAKAASEKAGGSE